MSKPNSPEEEQVRLVIAIQKGTSPLIKAAGRAAAVAGIAMSTAQDAAQKVHVEVQHVLHKIGKSLQEFRTKDGSIRQSVPIEVVQDTMRETYNDMVHEARVAAKFEYRMAKARHQRTKKDMVKFESQVKKADRTDSRAVWTDSQGDQQFGPPHPVTPKPKGNPNKWGKEGHKPISSKLATYRNFFWSLADRKLHKEVMAAVANAGDDEKGLTWEAVSTIAFQVQEREILGTTAIVTYGRPLPEDERDNIWYIPESVADDLTPVTDDQGREVAEVTHGSGDHEYSKMLEIGKMPANELYQNIARRNRWLKTTASKCASDHKALVKLCIPEGWNLVTESRTED